MSASAAVPARELVVEPSRPSVLVSSDGALEIAHRRLLPWASRPGFRMDEAFIRSFAVYERLYLEAVARERRRDEGRPDGGWPAGPVPFVLTDRGVAAGGSGDLEALLAVIR